VGGLKTPEEKRGKLSGEKNVENSRNIQFRGVEHAGFSAWVGVGKKKSDLGSKGLCSR